MSRSFDEISKDALELSDRERALLVDTILESLDTAVDAEWREEVIRREEQLQRGEAKLESGDEVFARVRDRLGA